MGTEDGNRRSFGNRPGKNLLVALQDTAWGVTAYDRMLFLEMSTLNVLRNNSTIISNDLKIYNTRSNARGVLQIRREFGNFFDNL